MNQRRMTALLSAVVAAMCLTGCGGTKNDNVTIGGTVTGLQAGTTLVLTDNGADSLTLTANGSFVLAGQLSPQNTYDVTVAAQPSGQNCTVTSGSGTVGYSGTDISNVEVSCQANVPVSVTVSGLQNVTVNNPSGGTLTGGTLTLQMILQNSPSDSPAPILVTSGTPNPITFTPLLTLGEVYAVSISGPVVQPPNVTVNGVTTTPAPIPTGQICILSGDYSGGVVSLVPIALTVQCN